jgi:DNA-binding GntR family transcriptional regulator
MIVKPAPLPRTSEGIAAAELRDAIVRGDLAPGAKIRQEATARELGISLIPLREALKTLTSEGIVTYRPQRGYFVTELPAGAIVDMYAVRELLEAEAERLGIERLDAGDLEAMRAHLRAQERAVEDRDPVEMIAANRGFHFAIFDRCANPWLLRFVTQLWDALDPYRVLSYRRMWIEDPNGGVPKEILAEHERIVVALDKRRFERAAALLANHRRRSETVLRELNPSAGATARTARRA